LFIYFKLSMIVFQDLQSFCKSILILLQKNFKCKIGSQEKRLELCLEGTLLKGFSVGVKIFNLFSCYSLEWSAEFEDCI